MEIHFGWGSREIEFVPGDGIKAAHIAWTHRERGGFGAEVTGISYHWWSDPASLPFLIANLQRLHGEYELWVTKELARYQNEGSPLSIEQTERVAKARADGLL